MTPADDSENKSDRDVSSSNEALINRIGQLTRTMHDSMRELGLDKEIARAAAAMPDARSRLDYIARTTEEAAERTLGAIERTRPLQRDMARDAEQLDQRWQAWFDKPIEQAEAKTLVADTRAYLGRVPGQVEQVDHELHDIMMAQDFQDLTGQVVARLTHLVTEIQSGLIEALVEHGADIHSGSPDAEPEEEETDDDSLVNGPVVGRDRPEDTVADQSEVDDILEQMGF